MVTEPTSGDQIATWVGLVALALSMVLAARTPARAQVAVLGADGAHLGTVVVVMREGDRTVLTVLPELAAPLERRASLVVSVPASTRAEDVRAIDPDAVERLLTVTAPRLLEQWEADPCGGGAGSSAPSRPAVARQLDASDVTTSPELTLLRADTTGGLAAWLASREQAIDPDALATLEATGGSLVVASIEPGRVVRAIRIEHASPELSVPLGLEGERDLVVIALARGQRMEPVGASNVFVATNLEVTREDARAPGAFYATLLARAFAESPGAIVTEHVQHLGRCSACVPGAQLEPSMLASLGADTLFPRGIVRPEPTFGSVPRVATEIEASSPGLSPEIVSRVIRRHMNELRFCYEQGLAAEPLAGGVVEARLTIAATGAVSDASAGPRDDALLSSEVTSCMARALRRWTFPAPSAGVPVDVTLAITTSFMDAPRTAVEGAIYEGELVATRLRVRGGAGELRTLRLRPAAPMRGGDDPPSPSAPLEHGARAGTRDDFVARYLRRHPWQGAIACDSPSRGRWDGRPLGADPRAPFAPRVAVLLTFPTSTPATPIAPLREGASAEPGEAQASGPGERATTEPEEGVPATTPAPTHRGGLCAAAHHRTSFGATLALAGIALLATFRARAGRARGQRTALWSSGAAECRKPSMRRKASSSGPRTYAMRIE